MGLRSWLFGKEEKKPEALVLGAELRCPYGTEHSYLIVEAEGMDIDSLPQACVSDCVAGKNIDPFGACYIGPACREIMELEKRWENPEPQNTLLDGEEIITTKSTLICKRGGMAIEAVTSGQDGIAAKQMVDYWKLVDEMDEKYPGLRNFLENQDGSLYLDEDMRQMALQFLEDYVKSKGELEISSLYEKHNLSGEIIKATLGHLLVTCDVRSLDQLTEGLSARGVINEMNEVSGWDARLLNEEMLEMIKKDSEETVKRVEEGSYYKWQEEHKRFLRGLGEIVQEFAYMYAGYYCAIASRPYRSIIEEKPAESVKAEEEKVREGSAETGAEKETGSEGGTPTNGYSNFADGMSPEDAERYIANNEKAFFNEFSERASKAGLSNTQITEAFEAMRAGDYAKMATYFDTSSPVDGAVFWSGSKGGAATYANSIDGTIMEQTPGGQVFDNWRGLSGMYPEWDTGTNLAQKPIWDALSAQYAEGAVGDVTYAHIMRDGMPYYGTVWNDIEKKILLQNMIYGKVTNISEVIIDAE